jgi:hypothetical protein
MVSRARRTEHRAHAGIVGHVVEAADLHAALGLGGVGIAAPRPRSLAHQHVLVLAGHPAVPALPEVLHHHGHLAVQRVLI